MIVIPDKNGKADHIVLRILEGIDSNIPLVPITITPDFVFNEELRKLDKYILFDYVEYGWNWDRIHTHLFGYNSHLFPEKFNTAEWKKFDDFIREKPPLVYFKRELRLIPADRLYNVYPIDWPCFHPIPFFQTKDEFNKRQADVIFAWGHSHEARRLLHGKIFIHASDHGYGVIDSPYHIERGLKEYKRVWLALQIPHYARIDMPQLLFIQGHAKVSISLPGAGVKCFRHAESPINSVMYMHEDGMNYSYDWENGVNCIRSVPGKEIEAIERALERDNLYEVYKEGVINASHYLLRNYQKNYIEPLIKIHS